MIWRLIAATIARLPWNWMSVGGRWLGFFVGSILRIRRQQALKALRRADVPDAEHVTDEVYRNLGKNVFELLWTAGRPAHIAHDLVDIDSWEPVENARKKGRGIVVATAHTGNWDLAACAMAQRINLAVVTKHLSWKSLDRFWQQLRAERSVDLIDARGALRHARDHLAKGSAVVFLIDQAPLRSKGVVEHPFLGALAQHDLTFASVAARYRAPVVLAFPMREKDGKHRVQVVEVIEPPTTPSRQWIVDTTKRTSDALDAFIRKAPEQWLWLHRRWRTNEKGLGAPFSSVQ